MFKILATTVLAFSGSMAFAGHGQTCCGGCAPSCTVPAACTAAVSAVPMAAVPAPQAAVTAPQTVGTQTYQSFSYEPGAAPSPVPVTTGRMMMTRPSVNGGGRLDSPWKYGDNKASGRYQWNAR